MERRKMKYHFVMFSILVAAGCAGGTGVIYPYEEVHWETTEYLHSFTHQHTGYSKLQTLWEMGFQHFPISNYYPSKPLYPLPADFVRANPGAIGAPNAEQHSTQDSAIHFNAVGSYYTTGYGETPSVQRDKSPITHEFKNLHPFDSDREPWRGIYRLDLAFVSVNEGGAPPSVTLTIDGALQVSYKDFAVTDDGGAVRDRVLTLSSGRSLTLKSLEKSMRVHITFDPATTRITQFRLMQGVYRPWRDAFRAALDGTLQDADGKPIEGLMFEDGGGITLNHPGEPLARICEQLDFDERVLGIEFWNQHEMFGGQTLERAAKMPFYKLWDDVLRSGRRCFGFCVKDHCLYGRGRNVLLVPGRGTERTAREHDALRAYRNGCFFGLLGAISVSPEGKPVPPYDKSEFRFTRLTVRRVEGTPVGVEVSVSGADPQQRPNTQIRFITDQGTALIADTEAAYFAFPCGGDGNVACRYVRVEAFAYPNTHLKGQALTAAALTEMDVFQIARLHNFRGDSGVVYMDADEGTPLGIVDIIFSQAILLQTKP